MSPNRAPDTLDAMLRALLLAVALSVFGIGVVIMLNVDRSSTSQGAPVYVAIIAILVLGAVDRQYRRLVRRRLPFSLGTHPAERRYNVRSLLLLATASALLLGIALYLTIGPSRELLGALAWLLALVAGPFVFAFMLRRFAKKPLERGIDSLLGEDADTARPSTFTFSFGTPPPAAQYGSTSATTRVRVLSDERAEDYRERWLRIRTAFDHDPPQAVRDAHALVLEVCAETGRPPIVAADERFNVSSLAGAVSALAAMGERMREARDVEGSVAAALTGGQVPSTDLHQAMREYERVLLRLLALGND